MKCLIKCLIGLILSNTSFSIKAEVLMQNSKQYCTENGGKVEQMYAMFGSSPGFSEKFCTFHKGNGLIVVGLNTYGSVKPSIAATLIKILPAVDNSSKLWRGSYANPSLNACRNLGGSSMSFYIMSGGFTNDEGQIDICTFGDGSMVSAWSLIYMTIGRDGYDEVKSTTRSIPLNIQIPS